MTLDPRDAGFQGDAEAPQLLHRLARRNRDVKWVIIGKSRGEFDFGPNVVDIWKDRRQFAESLDPVPVNERSGYSMRWDVKWAGNPAWWASEVSQFEDMLEQSIASLDGVVVHLGQHGTSNISIPEAPTTWSDALADLSKMTNPQDWTKSYSRFLIRGLNALGDRTNGQAPIVWICTDPRNYMKARDVKWHTGTDNILAQYDWVRTQKQDRFLDPRTPADFGLNGHAKVTRNGELWEVTHTYRLAGLELMILPDDWRTWGYASWQDRLPAGIASTSFKSTNKEPRRSQLIRDIMLRTYPDAEIFGKWDKESLNDVADGQVQLNDPRDFPEILNRWRVTLSLPALGSSWTVAKPYQCFAANVVCFMYGRLDDRGWILPTRRRVKGVQQVGLVDGIKLYSVRSDWTDAELKLARWLRIESADEFAERSKFVVENEATWRSLALAQRELLERRWNESFLENEIEHMLGLENPWTKRPQR